MRKVNRFRALSILSILAAAAGCTLVNGFDDVKQPFEPDYVPGTKSAPLDPDSAAPDTTDDAASDAAAPTAKDVLVVGGEAADDAGTRVPVLAVLDSATGAQIGGRETMHVAGLAYDAARDVWYVFEAPNDFVPTPSDMVKLHLRKLDRATGAWTELSSISVPPISFYAGIGVTSERISYMAYDDDAGVAVGTRLVTISTTNTAGPFVLDSQILARAPTNIVAARGNAGAGGYLTLVNAGRPQDGDCPGYPANNCTAKLTRLLVPNNGAPTPFGSPITVGMMTSRGFPSAALVTCGGEPDDVVVTPNGADGGWRVHTVGYQNPIDVDRGGFTMNPNTSLLRPAAFDDLRRIVFIVEANTDTNVYAVPLDVQGASVKVSLGHSGQSVYYDPTSQTVFAPYNQGEGFSFSAYRVHGQPGSLQLKPRTKDTDWNPPADLRPILLGVRSLATINCP